MSAFHTFTLFPDSGVEQEEKEGRTEGKRIVTNFPVWYDPLCTHPSIPVHKLKAVSNHIGCSARTPPFSFRDCARETNRLSE